MWRDVAERRKWEMALLHKILVQKYLKPCFVALALVHKERQKQLQGLGQAAMHWRTNRLPLVWHAFRMVISMLRSQRAVLEKWHAMLSHKMLRLHFGG